MKLAALSNSEIKRLRALREKKFRDETGLFTVEGEKMVEEALKSGFEVVGIYRRDEIGQEAMERISALSSPSPVLAVVRQPRRTTDIPSALAGGGLFLALDTIRDPGNLGTILRIADWFGVSGVFATAQTVELYNPKVVQATMGAVFRQKYHIAALSEVAECVKSCGGSVYGTFLDGENMYTKALATGADAPVLLVIGNESLGISPEMAAHVTDRIFIPPYPADDPGSESLNAAVATAIAVAEFRRRLKG